MTNKEKALIDVVTLFLLAAAIPALLMAVLTYLVAIFTVGQVFTGIGIAAMSALLVMFGKMYYKLRLEQLETLEKMRGGK